MTEHLQPKNTRLIRDIAYDQDAETLTMTFFGAMAPRVYHDVPVLVYRGFWTTQDPDDVYHRVVEKGYRWTRAPDG